MRRKLFTLAAGVSAVLFVGACVLWVRGGATRDQFSLGRAGGWLVQVGSGEGRLSLVVVRGWPLRQAPRWDSARAGWVPGEGIQANTRPLH